MEDDELYSSFLYGNTESFDKLMVKYGDHLVCFLKGYLRSIEDAEDMMIEAFASIMARKPNIGAGNFKSYLFRVGHNLVYHHYKKEKRLDVFSLENLDDELPDGEHFEDKLLDDEKKKALHRCLQRLDPELREAVWLVYFEKLHYEEAARIMGIARKKVDNLLTKAKGLLRAELKKEGFEEAT